MAKGQQVCLYLIIWFLFRYVYLSVLVMHLFLIYNCSSGLRYRDLKSIRYLPWNASSLSISYKIHTTKKYTCIRSPSVYSFVIKIDIDNFFYTHQEDTPGRCKIWPCTLEIMWNRSLIIWSVTVLKSTNF